MIGVAMTVGTSDEDEEEEDNETIGDFESWDVILVSRLIAAAIFNYIIIITSLKKKIHSRTCTTSRNKRKYKFNNEARYVFNGTQASHLTRTSSCFNNNGECELSSVKDDDAEDEEDEEEEEYDVEDNGIEDTSSYRVTRICMT